MISSLLKSPAPCLVQESVNTIVNSPNPSLAWFHVCWLLWALLLTIFNSFLNILLHYFFFSFVLALGISKYDCVFFLFFFKTASALWFILTDTICLHGETQLICTIPSVSLFLLCRACFYISFELAYCIHLIYDLNSHFYLFFYYFFFTLIFIIMMKSTYNFTKWHDYSFLYASVTCSVPNICNLVTSLQLVWVFGLHVVWVTETNHFLWAAPIVHSAAKYGTMCHC